MTATGRRAPSPPMRSSASPCKSTVGRPDCNSGRSLRRRVRRRLLPAPVHHVPPAGTIRQSDLGHARDLQRRRGLRLTDRHPERQPASRAALRGWRWTDHRKPDRHRSTAVRRHDRRRASERRPTWIALFGLRHRRRCAARPLLARTGVRWRVGNHQLQGLPGNRRRSRELPRGRREKPELR